MFCGRTSRGHTEGRSHRISPPSFCGASLHFYRERDLAVLFPRRPGSQILCTHEIIVLHLLGMIVRKNPSSCDCAKIRTHVPTSEGFELRIEPPGRTYVCMVITYYSRVWINRVRLPMLLVIPVRVACEFSLLRQVKPSRVILLILHTQAESYLYVVETECFSPCDTVSLQPMFLRKRFDNFSS